MWSIPLDRERDFDCILSDAIRELEDRRVAIIPRGVAQEEVARELAAARQALSDTQDELTDARIRISVLTPGASNYSKLLMRVESTAAILTELERLCAGLSQNNLRGMLLHLLDDRQ